MIRVLIVDDHAVLRAGLRLLIATTNDMTVVGEAADGNAGLAAAKELQPDVVLMDVTMPGKGGLLALREMREASPEVKVVILTMHDDQAYLRSTLSAGASGYVLKRSADTDLLNAIRAVSKGETFVDSTLAHLLQDPAKPVSDSGATTISLLSARERDVLVALARGYTNREIAERLHVSVKTIETHRTRLSNKLGLHTRADLVRCAFEAGLLTPDVLSNEG